MTFTPRTRAVALGALVAFSFSLLFSYPLIPVFVAIAVAARLGKSNNWRAGMLYGGVIGPSGFILRISRLADLADAPFDVVLALLYAAVIFGVIGIGITKLFGGEESIMW